MKFSKEMSPIERMFRVSTALIFIGMGVYLFLVQQWMWRAPSYKYRNGIFFTGLPKNLMAFALFSAALSLLSLVVLHYRDTAEPARYRLLARLSKVSAWVFFWSSVALNIYERIIK